METHRVYLSIGSNLGEKEANCRNALAELEKRGIARVKKVSPFYRTDPMDYLDQDWFVNAAAEIQTRLAPQDLLAGLQAVQADLGTITKSVRFGPRVIDLDILLYDDLILHADSLVIPHERMHLRAFVLVPLCDIAHGVRHPVLIRTMAELLSDLPDHQGVYPLSPSSRRIP